MLSASEDKVVLNNASGWMLSSQRAEELYRAGTKLWTKEDLQDIERQLTSCRLMARFSVRLLDGRTIEIVNPMYQKENPIWEPYVEFQEYWQLVFSPPEGKTKEYQSSYMVEWNNQAAKNFQELQAQPERVFDEKDWLWQNSTTCKMLSNLVQDLLGKGRGAKKVVCFGLGDFSRCAPHWFKVQHNVWGTRADVDHSSNAMIQHAVALTMARFCGNEMGSLFAQDPDYSESSEEILSKKDFQIVGRHGAGGFAEIDDDSIVISAFPNAPVKQMIADLARPVLIISRGYSFFNEKGKPFADADSPRTRDMWVDYDTYCIPVDHNEVEMRLALQGLQLYHRRPQAVEARGD